MNLDKLFKKLRTYDLISDQVKTFLLELGFININDPSSIASATSVLAAQGFVNIHKSIVYGPLDRFWAHPTASSSCVIFNTNCGKIRIGKGVIIGHHAMILTGRHVFSKGAVIPWNDQKNKEGFDIEIGDDCWIASGAIISGGLTLGKGCLVKAGAVVTKSFPPHTILAGVPARAVGSTLERSAKTTPKRLSAKVAKKKKR